MVEAIPMSTAPRPPQASCNVSWQNKKNNQPPESLNRPLQVEVGKKHTHELSNLIFGRTTLSIFFEKGSVECGANSSSICCSHAASESRKEREAVAMASSSYSSKDAQSLLTEGAIGMSWKITQKKLERLEVCNH